MITESSNNQLENMGNTLPSNQWNHHNVLDLDDFSHTEITTVLSLADRMREILDRRNPRVPALRGYTIVNLFFEPSTRTRASFELL